MSIHCSTPHLCIAFILVLLSAACSPSEIVSSSPTTTALIELPQPSSTPVTLPQTDAIIQPVVHLQPVDLSYLGAFRLPEAGERPRTFEYGGSALTYRPGSDEDNDGFPGTLFITGHDRLAYGELPDGSQVAEISIPQPIISQDVASLNTAAFLQDFQDVASGHFHNLDEIPRIGLAYLDHPATGPLLHLAWGQHMPPEQPAASHAWISFDLSAPDFQGEWYIGYQDTNSINGYLFEIPQEWADSYTGGRPLATGRFRDGGWSGMGPALFAYQPWIDVNGTPAPPGTHLTEIVLLQYASSYDTPNIEHSLVGYQHPDEWEGGAWLTTSTGQSAVIFAGTKSIGEKYWYGFTNPTGPQVPCVAGDFVGQFTICYLADGSACPSTDLIECPDHNDMRGWWSAQFEAQILFYAPEDLARVATGQIQPWEPQPYAVMSLEPFLFHNPDGIEPDMLGVSAQRRYRIGEVAYDRTNGLLYVLELFADGAKPVVHVWHIE